MNSLPFIKSKLIKSKFSTTRSQKGFTLIELLVVVSLSVMLLLTITAMFMTFLLSSAKTNIKQKVADEGSFALKQMEFLLRNSTKLVANSSGDQLCQTNMSAIAFQSFDGGVTELGVGDDQGTNKIASSSAAGNKFLTSDAVTIQSGPIFDCTDYGNSTLVKIDFTLAKAGQTNPLDVPFSTQVILRNQ